MEKLELRSPTSGLVHEIYLVNNITGSNEDLEKYFDRHDNPGMLERFEDAMKQLLQINNIAVRQGETIFFEDDPYFIEDVAYAAYPGRTVVSIVLK